MLRYFPIDFDVRVPATALGLQRLEYLEGRSNFLTAYFCSSDPSSLLKVVFDHAVMFRVIDDFHHPIEEVGFTDVGHVPNHFAYRMEESFLGGSEGGSKHGVSRHQPLSVRHRRLLPGRPIR